MKIIDIFNKIANGEEVPKIIQYDDCKWFWCEPCKTYESEDGKTNIYNHFSNYGNLNDVVKILDEEDEFENIEEIEHQYIYGLNENEEKIDDRVSRFEDKINALIKNQKKIIAKLGDNK